MNGATRPIALVSIAGGLVLWQLADGLIHNALYMAGPLQVLAAFGPLFRGGYAHDLSVTAWEFAIGLAIALGGGVAVGTVMALNAPLRTILQPWISAVYATPLIALAPVIILWFGIGLPSKVFVVALIGIFPVIVNTEAGVLATDADLVEMARAMGLSRFDVVRKIHVRSALPMVVAGARLAVAHGLTGVVVAELFGAKAGIGAQITKNTELYDMATVFACVVSLALAGIVLSALLRRLERSLRPWAEAA